VTEKDLSELRVPFIPGERVLLDDGDCFGTKTVVTILKVYRGGNALVRDGCDQREVGINRLVRLESK